MTARWLHVLGGSPWQTPTVARARELGLKVLVTDMYAERPAYALADAHEQVDITHLDATLEVARRRGVHGVLCDTTDVGVPTAAYVAEALGLPGMGYETALNFTDKLRMRDRAQRAGCHAPAFERVTAREQLEGAAKRLAFPLVLKPADNQSGRGVSVVHGSNGLDAAFDFAAAASRRGDLIAEEWLEGDEVIVDGFVIGGRVTLLGIADKERDERNPTVARRIAYRSGDAFHELAEPIQPIAQRMMAAMGLHNGIFHTEFILHARGATPIDVAARGGGVMIYTRVLRHVSGVDAMAAMIRLAVGQNDALAIDPIEQRRGACIEFLRVPPGRFIEMQGVDNALAMPGVAAVHLAVEPGAITGSLTKKDDRPGFVVAFADSGEEAIARAGAAASCLHARMEKER